MLRNLIIALLLAIWFVLVVACAIGKQWGAVCGLFGLAWTVEQCIATQEEEPPCS